jgi:hypothetical protein
MEAAMERHTALTEAQETTRTQQQTGAHAATRACAYPPRQPQCDGGALLGPRAVGAAL